jgi:uncharacterized membrane protein YdbT with pleckstrin-like domain
MTSERRPEQSLFVYYVLMSLLLGPFFIFLLIPLYFRYHTLRYFFDEQGISMSWGVIFLREVSLTYARIQDIHLSSNIVERWLGLARVQIQTASGSADAEMTIEGLKDFEQIRDHLYSKMRGTASERPSSRVTGLLSVGDDLLSAVLREIAAEVRELRISLERTSS